VDRDPGGQRQRDVDPGAADAAALQVGVEREGEDGDTRGDEVELRGEQDRDDEDRAEVVDHRQRQQEDPGAARQVRRGQRQHPQRERDVGGDRDGPGAVDPRRSPADGERDQCRDDHAADRGHHRQDRLFEPRELADHQFAFEFEARDEEEQCEQTVLGPVADGQIQMEEFGTEPEVANRAVNVVDGRIRPEQGDRGGAEQDHPARGFRAEIAGEVGDDGFRGAGGTAGHGILRSSATTITVADQTSRRTLTRF
jgi:hypothetical protein